MTREEAKDAFEAGWQGHIQAYLGAEDIEEAFEDYWNFRLELEARKSKPATDEPTDQ